MVYFDYSQGRFVPSTPSVIPDIRAHVANWNHFRRATQRWPTLSIVTFLLRFVLAVAGAGFAVWYGLVLHDWSRDQYYLYSLGALIPVLFCWYLIERAAWNRDLRVAGLSSASDVWGLQQFPSKDEHHPRNHR